MPRSFDSDALDGAVLRFTALVDCETCGVTFDGVWEDSSLTVEDVAEIVPATQTCPAGHSYVVEYPGWAFFSEA